MAKICNQTFVKDQYRDRKYIGTMKCMHCEEESNIRFRFPIKITDFNKIVKAFVSLHTLNGCNKVQSEAPLWACGSVELGLAGVGLVTELTKV
jgi:hypothetical protein